ncbi:hypothetical protein OJAV_G00039290 [Oryzias javanicus]|uniref:Uncharacterized protein n=1 Tax=Oryzias javanicus TaxID=123683 RepID=A0A3S2N3F3_ORYJA|nr:hypothetical protein OJAV_G00039290 [Oryzias javanicus]
MLLRRKLCVAVLVAAVLLLMLASQSIHRRHFLPMLIAPPHSRAPPIKTDSEVKPTEPPAIINPNPPIKAQAAQEERKEEEENTRKDQPVHDVQKQQRQCGCLASCVSELGGSEWFSRRYDPQQDPLLREDISSVDPAALQWWLGLQRSGGDVTLEEVMSQMFQVIPPKPGHQAPPLTLSQLCGCWQLWEPASVPPWRADQFPQLCDPDEQGADSRV